MFEINECNWTLYQNWTTCSYIHISMYKVEAQSLKSVVYFMYEHVFTNESFTWLLVELHSFIDLWNVKCWAMKCIVIFCWRWMSVIERFKRSKRCVHIHLMQRVCILWLDVLTIRCGIGQCCCLSSLSTSMSVMGIEGGYVMMHLE